MTKFLHIQKPARSRWTSDVRFSLCGRRVGLMSLGKPEEATCTRCLAEHLTRPEDSTAKTDV